MRKKNIISKFAKKDLGQNFLHNVQVRDDILEEAGDISEKKILEIGPGLGFLTSSLLATKADVYAVEFDKRVAEIISRDFGHMKNFHLFNVDFLQFDLDDLFKNDKYSIIANIPYNITAPIFRKVLEKTENKPEFAIFMVQKEVGQKVCKPKKRSIYLFLLKFLLKLNIALLFQEQILILCQKLIRQLLDLIYVKNH